MVLGFAAPMAVWTCAEVHAACRHVQRENIDTATDRLAGLFLWLHHWLCSGQAIFSWVLGVAAAMLAAAAGALLLLR